MKEAFETVLGYLGLALGVGIIFFVLYMISGITQGAYDHIPVLLLSKILGIIILYIFIRVLWATTVGIRDGQEWF